jgi:hypothetical protein
MQTTRRTRFSRRWGWKGLLGGALLSASLASGCESMSNTDKGVLGGAAAGGLLGGLIGRANHNTGAGAVIGAVAGGVTGGLIGNEADKRQAKRDADAAAAQRTIGLEEVAKMTQQGVSDSIIIDQIRTSGVVYNLTGDQIIWLQQSGVHEVVIREMQATAYRTPRRVYVAEPPPVVVVEPAPPPPVGVGVGFSYSRGR